MTMEDARTPEHNALSRAWSGIVAAGCRRITVHLLRDCGSIPWVARQKAPRSALLIVRDDRAFCEGYADTPEQAVSIAKLLECIP
jgi:hypothetical protein